MFWNDCLLSSQFNRVTESTEGGQKIEAQLKYTNRLSATKAKPGHENQYIVVHKEPWKINVLESPVRINLCQLLDVSEISTKEFPED
jgi:hypothetical protein